MAINDNYQGIPIAYMVFSAQEKALAGSIHSDYNIALLEQILFSWVSVMGTNELSEKFKPKLALRDNNPCHVYHVC